jgi:hypothetical protein
MKFLQICVVLYTAIVLCSHISKEIFTFMIVMVQYTCYGGGGVNSKLLSPERTPGSSTEHSAWKTPFSFVMLTCCTS